MTGTSGELLQAVYGLRKAAEAEFSGNEYYRVANEIAGLAELLGWDQATPAGKDAAYGFASMLAEVRKLAGTGVTGNRYYIIVHKLDALQAILTPPAKETGKAGAMSEKPVAPVAAAAAAGEAAAPKRDFSELAAASAARVQDVAESLGIAAAHHIPPVHAAVEADGELERRSSEPCAMAELAPVSVEPVASAAIPAETIAAPSSKEAVHDAGSEAAQTQHGTLEGTGLAAAAPQTAAEPALQPSLPAHDAKTLAAGQKVEEETLAERRLERRSSEAGAEILEPVEPAAIPAEGPPEPNLAEAAFYLGSPAPESDAELEEESVREDIAAAEAAAELAAAVSAPVFDTPAPSAGQKIEVKKPDQTKAKPPKTLFKLWLDLAFGRKD
ncbi:MAG: hypothetical protein ACLP7P_19955 [Rhodomicrobium sp.]